MAPLFRIGARGSPLSMIQARRVQARLAEIAGLRAGLGAGLGAADQREARAPITAITTTGDRIQDQPLSEAGGKGLFTKELDEALLAGRIDLAVHSAKDLPTRLPPGVVLVCTPEREDPRDAFVSLKAKTLNDLPAGAVIGSASIRRQAQALYLRPDLQFKVLRGNVDTRLRKIEAGQADATFLALAGLKRLGLADRASSIVAIDDMPPAAGQGALAITARADDSQVRDILAGMNNQYVWTALAAERAFLLELDGSCRTPIAAFGARIDPDMPEGFDPDGERDLALTAANFHFIGEVIAPDGRQRFRQTHAVFLPAAEDAAETFGRSVALALKQEAGDALEQMGLAR